MLRLDLERRELTGAELDVPRSVGSRPFDHVLDRRSLAERFLDRLPHRDPGAAPERVVGGDHDLRLGVTESLDDRRRCESGEDRNLDRTDVGAGVRRNRDPSGHRHVDRDPVSGRYAEPRQRFSEPDDLARQLRERQLVALSVLALEDGGGRVLRSPGPDVDAHVGDVQPGALEPGRPLDSPGVVANGVPVTHERDAEIVADGAPEAVGLVHRHAMKSPVAVAAEARCQTSHVCLLELVGRRHPRELVLRLSVSVC